jgi:hypothetical protein
MLSEPFASETELLENLKRQLRDRAHINGKG